MTNRDYRRNLRQGDGLPDIPDHAAYMLAAFRACGVWKAGGMAATALDWPDVLAYADGTGDISRGPDVATLYHMCRAYMQAHAEAKADVMTIAPADRA